MENKYEIVHQLVCSNCGNRDLESGYSSDMEENHVYITCRQCGASTEVGKVDLTLDKHAMLVNTPTLNKSQLQIGLNQKHNERFYKLISKDNTAPTDRERIALFFIISGVHDLYTKVNNLYDFKTHWIKDNYLETVDFSSSTIKMIQLGFNLYNNSTAPAPLELFSTLDNENYRIAMKAINIRFNKI